jgi:16S rRNA G966 N2-methylase RsmD
MKREDAEEWTQAQAQVGEGWWRANLLADQLGVPAALDLSFDEWMKKRVGARIRLTMEARKIAAIEMKANGESNRKIAKVLGVAEGTVRNDLAAQNYAEQESGSPDSETETAQNCASATKSAQTRTAHEKIAKFAFDMPAADLPAGPAVRLGDFYDLSVELADNSVDLIFTDPPYDDESLPLFGKMAEVANRVLKPGGSLVTYLGHMQLLEAGRDMSKHLRYWHPLCCFHAGGPLARMTEFGVIESFKPMLWFVKGTRGDKHTFVESMVSGAREKDHHPWQQAESEAAYFIEKLSPENGLVVDFFAGGGTTIVAANRLNRKAIGYELNEKHQRRANERIEAAT